MFTGLPLHAIAVDCSKSESLIRVARCTADTRHCTVRSNDHRASTSAANKRTMDLTETPARSVRAFNVNLSTGRPRVLRRSLSVRDRPAEYLSRVFSSAVHEMNSTTLVHQVFCAD